MPGWVAFIYVVDSSSCIAASISFTLRRATRNGLRQRRLEGSTTRLQQVGPPLEIGSGGSSGTLKDTLNVRLDAAASSAALRATLSALDEPVFEGVIAAHSASTGSRSAPPAFGRAPPLWLPCFRRPTVALHGEHSALHSGLAGGRRPLQSPARPASCAGASGVLRFAVAGTT